MCNNLVKLLWWWWLLFEPFAVLCVLHLSVLEWIMDVKHSQTLKLWMHNVCYILLFFLVLNCFALWAAGFRFSFINE